MDELEAALADFDMLSARVIAYRDADRSYACRKVVVDASFSPPKVIVSRDLPNVIPGQQLRVLLKKSPSTQPAQMESPGRK
jgi:hypothetical protein